MDLGIARRVAVITGAGGGIGACIAEKLGSEGAKIVIADIDQEKAEAQASRLAGQGVVAIAVQADVSEAASVENLMARGREAFGSLDILINNAGFQRDMRIGKMTEADWDSVVDVILKGAFLCSKAALPHMQAQKWGRILNMSSRAHLGNPGQANYSAAKAGLLGFTRALSMENGKFGVTVNAVAPGIVETDAIRSLPHFDKIRMNAEATTPVPRMGRVEDVADAVAFLVSERAGFVSGEVLHITGGRY